MFWLDIPGGLAIILMVFLFVDHFVHVIKNKRNKKQEDKRSEEFNVYLKLFNMSPEEQARILTDRPYYRRVFYKGCRRFDESGEMYGRMESIRQGIKKSRMLRRKVRIRNVCRKIHLSTMVSVA